MRKCKGIGEVAILEPAEARSRTTMARKAATDTTDAEPSRKRKIVACAGELNYSTSLVQMRSRRRIVVKLENSSSNDPCASCCSSNGSTEVNNETSEFVDLKEEQEESVEISTSTYEYESCTERRETTPSSEVRAVSGELESTAKPESEVNSRSRPIEEKMPSKDELDEFFSAAEQDLQKQYADKYNFDFVKEEPSEGAYEWVRIKP